MAGLIYYDADVHAVTDLYDILKAIPNFWDSTDDETSELTKGGITLTLSTNTKTISGYGLSVSLNLSSNSLLIAATERGLIIYTGTGTQTTGVIAIGCDKDGNWAGSAGGNINARVNNIIAEGVSSTSFGHNSVNILSSNTMTQIIDLATDKGNFIFDDLRRVLMCSVEAYNGKLTMPNGEKYVKCGAYALRYTE